MGARGGPCTLGSEEAASRGRGSGKQEARKEDFENEEGCGAEGVAAGGASKSAADPEASLVDMVYVVDDFFSLSTTRRRKLHNCTETHLH